MTISLAAECVVRHMKPFRIPYQTSQSLYNWSAVRYFQSKSGSSTNGKITIDGIEKELKTPKNPLYVPQKFGKLLAVFGHMNDPKLK